MGAGNGKMISVSLLAVTKDVAATDKVMKDFENGGGKPVFDFDNIKINSPMMTYEELQRKKKERETHQSMGTQPLEYVHAYQAFKGQSPTVKMNIEPTMDAMTGDGEMDLEMNDDFLQPMDDEPLQFDFDIETDTN